MKSALTSVSIESPLNAQEQAIVRQPTHALLQVTDVGDFPKEYDAKTTIMVRHLVPLQSEVFSIGNEPHTLKYAADFLSSLKDIAEDRIVRAEAQASSAGREIPVDVVEARRKWEESTLRVLLNYAPRNQRKIEGKNGNDFYLAFVNGVEVYAVPSVALQYLKARNKIDSLFRIPTKDHPLTTSLEQFRSSLFGKTAHEAEEHLQLIWRRGDIREEFDHVIPNLLQDEVAFVDRPYHNRRIVTPDFAQTQEKIDQHKDVDGTVLIRVGQSIIRAHCSDCLANVPEGEWGLWFNPADVQDEGTKAAYYELSRRWEPGKDWSDRGQLPSHYLARQDRKIGAKVEILPKGSSRRVRDVVRSGIAQLRRSA